jgi:glycosyltransferase involved in cell wall biosynthesis
MSRTAKVTIGLPVFNGENFLAEAIESILGQSYGDLRLVISDNCSTDATEQICRKYLELDSRVEYHRQSKNIGGAPNYNFVFQPEGSDYFKWAAHDDLMEPNFLSETVPLLDDNQDVTIAHGRSLEIDEIGRIKGDFDFSPCLCDPSPSNRLWGIIWADYFTEVFGLLRVDAVLKTRLHGSFPGSDRNLMAELLLLGNVAYTREVIFRRRAHPDSYVHALKSARAQQQWFDPSVRFGLPPFLSKSYFYWRAIEEADITPSERAKCRRYVARWARIRLVETIGNNRAGLNRTQRTEINRSRGLVPLGDALGIDD